MLTKHPRASKHPAHLGRLDPLRRVEEASDVVVDGLVNGLSILQGRNLGKGEQTNDFNCQHLPETNRVHCEHQRNTNRGTYWSSKPKTSKIRDQLLNQFGGAPQW